MNCYVGFIFFSHLFILYRGYLPSACLFSTAGVPRENKPTLEGIEQSHSPPLTSPSPFPTLSASSCPTASGPVCPVSLPHDLLADKTTGPCRAQCLVPELPSHTKLAVLCRQMEKVIKNISPAQKNPGQ